MRRLLFSLVLIASVAIIPAAAAGPGMFVGVNDDTLKWSDSPQQALGPMDDLGLRASRVTLTWTLGKSALSANDAYDLAKLTRNSSGRSRILLSVYTLGSQTPVSEADQQAFCQFATAALSAAPQIKDINIGNEVNKSFFFRPQFNADGSSAAPALYVSLLSKCYGLIKAAHPSVNVVASLSPRGNDNPSAVSNVSHSPIKFISEMGRAYKGRALSGRIFDHFGQNVYGELSNERPWKAHPNNSDVTQGDYPKLMQALGSAFAGTGQPVPGQSGVSVWYLETGFQTAPSSEKAGLYEGSETDAKALQPYLGGSDDGSSASGPDQATQLADSIRLAYCQPAVGAYFNFMLADEKGLYGWQSGVLWADYSPKPGYDVVKAAVREVNAGAVNCKTLKGGPVALVPQVADAVKKAAAKKALAAKKAAAAKKAKAVAAKKAAAAKKAKALAAQKAKAKKGKKAVAAKKAKAPVAKKAAAAKKVKG